MSWTPMALALLQPRQREMRGAGKRYTVYALYDAGDLGIRYIGVTTLKLEERLSWHYQKPTNRRMREWLSAKRARIARLEEVAFSEWEDAERGWVFWCREHGELLNADRGGAARDRSGVMRPFREGRYQPPTRHATGDRLVDAVVASESYRLAKVQPKAPKRPDGGPKGRYPDQQRRPRLVPVAAGVFKRV